MVLWNLITMEKNLWLCKWQKNCKLGCQVHLSPWSCPGMWIRDIPWLHLLPGEETTFSRFSAAGWRRDLEGRGWMRATWQEERCFRSFECKEHHRKLRDFISTYFWEHCSSGPTPWHLILFFSPVGILKGLTYFHAYFVIICGFRPTFPTFSGSLRNGNLSHSFTTWWLKGACNIFFFFFLVLFYFSL